MTTVEIGEIGDGPRFPDSANRGLSPICAFLGETLELWGVAGAVEPGDAPVVAVIRAADGTTVWIERAQAGPFRWLARWRAAGEAPGGVRERRPRACASLVGLLGALRGALGVERGTPVRVASAPPA